MFDWQQLPKPFFVLAPMEGVTDTVFRQVIMKAARPDVFMTEFISVEGFCSRGYPGMKVSLIFTKKEKPLIAQIWGYTPDLFFTTANRLMEMGYDGIDINMGCPDRAVMKKGCGAAMIKTPALAAAIIESVKAGVAGRGPVSVKTRIGFDKIVTEEWVEFILKQRIDALTVHGRTAKELSKVPAHWDEIGKAVKLRDRSTTERCVVVGNGDVESRQEGEEKAREYGVDGVMIGRGVFKNPWVFGKKPVTSYQKQEKIALLHEHLDLFERTWQEKKPVCTLRKFYKIYVNGFDGALAMRVQLMEANTLDEVRAIIARD
jgi:nifR3 family TIM-barrel protein